VQVGVSLSVSQSPAPFDRAGDGDILPCVILGGKYLDAEHQVNLNGHEKPALGSKAGGFSLFWAGSDYRLQESISGVGATDGGLLWQRHGV